MLEYRGKASDFGAFLERNVNRVGYLIGTRGQTCTQAMINSRLANTSYKDYWDNIRLYAPQWLGKVVADCEGIYDMFMNGGAFDKPLAAFKYADTTANGQYALAKSENLPHGAIADLPRDYPYPIAVHFDGHIGFYYKGVVYQSIGHRRGFITTTLEELVNGKRWLNWFYIPYLDYSEDYMDVYCKYGDGRETSTSFSKEVWAMQEGLIKLGFKMISDKEYPADGRYGNATVNGVQSFKTKFSLPGDGKTFEKDCVTFLLEELHDLETGVPQALYDAEVAKVKSLTADILTEKAKVTALQTQVTAMDQEIVRLGNDYITVNTEKNRLAGLLAELKAMRTRESAILS